MIRKEKRTNSPQGLLTGMNDFLKDLDVLFWEGAGLFFGFGLLLFFSFFFSFTTNWLLVSEM